MHRFRLYIAGDSPNSVQARANFTALGALYLPEPVEIEIVDVFIEPERALEDGIFLTPTLVKLSPGTTLRITGNLSDMENVLNALGLSVPTT